MFSSCVPLMSTLVNPVATISSIPTSLIHCPHLHFIPPTPLIFVLLHWFLFSTLFIEFFSTPQTLNVGALRSFVHGVSSLSPFTSLMISPNHMDFNVTHMATAHKFISLAQTSIPNSTFISLST